MQRSSTVPPNRVLVAAPGYAGRLPPIEAMVLSYVDGERSLESIASLCGLDADEALGIANALEQAGAVVPLGPIRSGTFDAVSDVDCDLTPELRKRIDDVVERASHKNHYVLLGVRRQASRKEINRAYLALAAFLHPDRYYNRRLGAYRHRIERVFDQITQAHEVLGSDRRAEYDRTLPPLVESGYEVPEDLLLAAETIDERPLTNEVQARVISSPPPAMGAASAMEPREVRGQPSGMRASVAPRASQETRTPSMPPTPITPAVAPVRPTPIPQARVPSVAPTDDQRREALARKLLRGTNSSIPPASSALRPLLRAPSTMPPAATPAQRPSQQPSQGPSQGLSQGPSQRPSQRPSQPPATLSALLTEALAAANGGNVVAAEALLRQAAEQSPPSALASHPLSVQVRDRLADIHVRLAQNEERHERWLDAGLAYLKALALRPRDHRINERSAYALFRLGKDLPRAQRLAETALAMHSGDADAHCTLGEVLLALGVAGRARDALNRALHIDPSHRRARLALLGLGAQGGP